MVHARSRIDRRFRLGASVEAAWALLRDVPRWGALFPGVASVGPFDAGGQPGESFVWRMAPMGPPGGRVETVYACRYAADPEAHTLTWTPVEDVGNARFAGSCALWADGAATAGRLQLDATLQIPAPSFVRALVEPAVALEMGRMTDTFLGRLDRALGV